jgi:hypothetical protein
MILTAFIAKTLLAASLTVPAALDRSVQWPLPERGTAMSVDQKDAAIGPLVKSATECIVRTVTADPRFPGGEGRRRVQQPDRGLGAHLRRRPALHDHNLRSPLWRRRGRTFFMGPYLDSLPAAVTVRVKDRR